MGKYNQERKLCSGCNIEKDRDEYPTRKNPKYVLWRCKKCVQKYRKDWWQAQSWQNRMFHTVRDRAKAKGLEFSITKEDLVIPEVCPVFGTKFDKSNRDTAPSLDRIDSTKGYTRDNIQVISWKANRLKNNATLEELQQLVKHMEKL